MPQLTPWVRQYTLRDLLDDSFDLFRERVTTLLLAGAIPAILVAVYLVVMRLVVFPGTFVIAKPGASLQELYRLLVGSTPFWLFVVGLACVNMVSSGIGYIAQCRIAAGHALGEQVRLKETYKYLAKPFWSLLVAGIIYQMFYAVAMGVAAIPAGALGALFGALFGAILGRDGGTIVGTISGTVTLFLSMEIAFLMATVFFLALPVSLARDHTGPFTALGKSFRTASSNYKAHVFSLYLISRIPLLVSSIVTAGMLILKDAVLSLSPTMVIIIGAMTYSVISVANTALMSCYQTLVYLDGRCRSANFDLKLLADEIGMSAEAAQILSPTAGTAVKPVQQTFPDYSAPVALREAATASAPAPSAFPDYSAPPPGVSPQQGEADGA